MKDFLRVLLQGLQVPPRKFQTRRGKLFSYNNEIRDNEQNFVAPN